MTTTDFAQPRTVQQSAGFDSGPLSWVMVEIREALGRSKTALFEAGGREREERATALQHARTHLRQAHGALVMADVEGAEIITLAAEQALDRFKDGTLEYNVGHAQIVAELYHALSEYLEDLLAGGPVQPVRLFPYYRALQTMLGAGRIHPADLFFPHAPEPGAIAAPERPAPADYPACRQRFEQALLPFLKSSEAEAQMTHAGALRDAVELVADAQQEPQARAFWLSMQAFAELVAGGQLASGLYVKQLFGLINLQMRRLTQGSAALPDGMLRDALFFVASVEQPTPGALSVRQAYRLDGMVPPDYETRRYGRIDQDALLRAQQALVQVKAAWQRLAAERAPELDAAFVRSLALVAGAAEQLKVPALGGLMQQLAEVVVKAAAPDRSAALDAEIATALLFAEHGLEQIGRLPDDFAGNAELIGARLNALLAGDTPPAPPQGDLSRQIEQGQTVAALADQMKAALRQAEKVLDGYYVDPSRRAGLAQADPLLRRVQDALATLDQDHAWRAAQQVNQAVQRLERGQVEPAGAPRALDEIAQNVSALGFFVDMLGRNAAAAKSRFHFDETAGTFRAMPFEKIAAADPVPVLDQELTLLARTEPAAMPVADPGADAELLDIFAAEAREVLAFIETTLALPREQSGSQENLAMLRRSFHTLKGSSRMIGLAQFADAAGAIERVMNIWLAEARAASDDLFALLAQAWRALSNWVDELAAGAASACNAETLIGAAGRLLGELDRAEKAAPAFGNVIEFPSATAPDETRDDHLKHIGDLQISLPLYNIYLAESDGLLRVLAQGFGEWRHEAGRAVSAEALKAVHALAGSSDTVGFKSLRELAQALAAALETATPPAPSLSDGQHDALERATDCIRQMLRSFALGELAPAQPEMIAALHALREQLQQAPTAESGLGTGLDALFAATYDSIVGAPAPVAPAAKEKTVSEISGEVLDDPAEKLDALFAATYDSIVANPPSPAALAEPAPPLRSPLPPAPDTSGIDDVCDSVFDDAEQLRDPPSAEVAGDVVAAPEAGTALVRVRADILDHLLNQTGEVSIARSRMENEIGVLRSSLSEFADNLTRLHRQLREVEMQAESQIASRMAIASEREFDPLEFDRFTRLQELTRMMAESVNDAAALHENLTRSVDSASDDLVLQARLTRDLQHGLTQIRMVPFSGIAERVTDGN